MSPKSKRVKDDEAFGMRYFINTKEARHERPHVHVCPGKGPRTPDLKIWLDNMMTSLKGEMDAADIAKAVKLVTAMKAEFLADYEAIHGKYIKRSKAKKRSAKK